MGLHILKSVHLLVLQLIAKTALHYSWARYFFYQVFLVKSNPRFVSAANRGNGGNGEKYLAIFTSSVYLHLAVPAQNFSYHPHRLRLFTSPAAHSNMNVFLGVSSLLQTANPQSPMLVFSTQGNDLIRVSLCTSWKTGQDSRLHCRCPPMKVNFIGNAEPKRCVKSTSPCAFPRTTMGGVGPTATSLGPQLRCPARLFSVCRPICWF